MAASVIAAGFHPHRHNVLAEADRRIDEAVLYRDRYIDGMSAVGHGDLSSSVGDRIEHYPVAADESLVLNGQRRLIGDVNCQAVRQDGLNNQCLTITNGGQMDVSRSNADRRRGRNVLG